MLSVGIGLLFMAYALLQFIAVVGFMDDPGEWALMAATGILWVVVVAAMVLRGSREYRKAREE